MLTRVCVCVDAEILERKYPVLLNEFSIRAGSGGRGLRRGGDGVVRELQFLQPLTVGILSERRAFGTIARAHTTHTPQPHTA
jgi:N-methylhydantoinase B/oxoprolinase/acetone carboxylase alpha subunit